MNPAGGRVRDGTAYRGVDSGAPPTAEGPGGQPPILADRRQRLRIEDVLQDRGERPLVRVFRRDDDLLDATPFTPAGLTPPDARQMHFSWPQRSSQQGIGGGNSSRGRDPTIFALL